MLVIIDTRVQAYQSLATGVCSGAKVIIIEQDGDAIAQITAALREYPSDSLHIVCHGEPGTLYLGKTPINWSNLEQYRHQLQKWQVTDILLYACNVAADGTREISSLHQPTGASAFLQRLHQLTGANVAASANRVGNAKQGGTWHLEHRLGNIASPLAFLPEVCSAYPGVLLASFSKATNFTVGTVPRSIVLRDFNGDGNPDLVTGNDTNNVSVLLGTGNGNFGTATKFPALDSTQSIAAADFNKDGKLDLATAGSASVLFGNGDGTFNTPTKLPTVASGSVASGDLNGDGFADIALTIGNGISVLQNKGDGSFGNPANFSVGGNPQTVTVGDLNGDGKLDLAAARSGNISVLFNKGDGSFGSPTNFSVGGEPFYVAIADFNSDGKADLATVHSSNASPDDVVSVLLGTGGGSFGSPTSFPVGDLAKSLAVEDFDKDGVLDLVVANQISNNVSVLLGTGTGSFGFATNFSIESNPSFVASADFNKDGKPDIATANFSGNVSVLLNTTPTSYTVTIAPGANPSELNSTDGTFVITLDNPAPGKGLTVNYSLATGGNAATPTTDYQLVAGANISTVTANSFTIAAGVTKATLKVAPVNDAVIDPNETVGITLAAGTGYTVGAANNASLTITDNDPMINISPGTNARELGSTNGTFNITINAPTTAPVTVNFNTTGSTANIPADYTFDLAASTNITAIGDNTFTIAAGVTSATLAVKPVDDGVIEIVEEKVRVNLAAGTGYTLGASSSTFADFTPATNFSAGSSPNSVAVGDLNKDGKLDLVTANASGVAVLLGNGDGSFGKENIFPGKGSAFNVAVEDFNGDGKLDLLTQNSQEISLLLGNGDGSFGEATNLSVRSIARFLVVGDFNKDGKFDIVAPDFQNNLVQLGRGDGSFVRAPLKELIALHPNAAIAKGDFNEDGFLDLVTVEPGPARLLLGNGDGSFVKGGEFVAGSYSKSVAAGDFNGDGHLDLATAKGFGGGFPNFGTVSVLLGTGTGTFGKATEFIVENPAELITAGDFNGDGKLDLATSNGRFFSSPGKVSVLLGEGDGSFNPSTNFSVGNRPSSMAVGDFNGDGKQDLATANRDSNNVSVLLNKNQTTASLTIEDNLPTAVNIAAGATPSESGPVNGTFTITLTKPAPVGGLTVNYSVATGENAATPTTDYQLVAGSNISAVSNTSFTIAAGATTATLNVAPVDDNAIDPNETVGIALEAGTGYRLASGNAVPKFTPAPSFPVNNTTNIAVADFNNDGFLDLAGDSGWIVLGQGDGSFVKANGFEPSSSAFPLNVGDFNEDGFIDLATRSGGGAISLLLGKGDGSFDKPTYFDLKSGFSSITTGDFNGDGHLDLATVGNTVFVSLGTGTGNFTAPIKSEVEAILYSPVAAADFNQDGKLDLATANHNANNVSLLLGKGDGTFEKGGNFSVGAGSNSVALGDFNQDGFFDLATANYSSKTVSVLLNKGDATFNPAANYKAEFPPVSIFVEDFNGDGKVDIATRTPGSGSGNISILLGQGDGTFEKGTSFKAEFSPFPISVADFNNDGQPDLFVATPGSAVNNGSVWLNKSQPKASLTIADNDPVGVQFSQPTYQVNENGTVVGAAVTINRTGDTASSGSIQVQLTNGNAMGGTQPFATGTDFDNTIQTINFASGETSKTLTIPINDDTLLEGDETLTLNLVNPSGNLTIGGQNAATLTIAANDTNNPPTVSNLNISGDEDTNVIFSASDFTSKFSDTNGDNLTKIQVTSLPNNGILKLSDANVTENQEIPVAELGNLRFTPNPNWNGNTSFNWNGFDGTTYALSPATVNLTVNSVNDAPFVSAAIPINQTAAINSLYNFTFPADTFSDVDSGDSLTYSATPGNSNTLPNWLSFNPITRTFVGIPTNSDVGTMSVLIKATDGANASTFASFNLTVTNPVPDCFCETIIRPDSDNISGVDTTPNPVDAIQLGSDLDDILIGTDAGDSLNGFGGNDWIFGKAGKDNLIGGADDDIIFGGSDRDYILGDSGDDLLCGNKGDDYIQGNPGNDIIWAGQGNDFARGGQNDDLLFGDQGDDTLTGDKGNDIIYGGDGRDLQFGGNEDDIVCGNIGDDTLFGEDGNDTVYGGQNDDIVFGDKGDDWLAGDRGNDSLCGAEGNDTAYGGSENDEICGGDGNDLLFGNQGEDTLNGELGDDTLYGGKDNDTIIGGAGNDWLHGGKGEDVFMITVGWGGDAIADFTDGEDLLGLAGGLIFPLLAISQNNNDTTISVKSSGEILAILSGIEANQIGEEDFVLLPAG
ncbi:FG-GAP-like repeat-containing protein [Microseira wollei]|uniref:FG-GAP repeat/calx-beta domain protein n=1 Tax=Microseira wollei NIES-4236 TaxID=2530354 RepID=A0AAV3XPR5_9CYAN|nr:FG-GAP-like repeat-containing protein [Microseira wollei]GET43910.1 FG-GAP repeat/calx-beta domain protein [Microseira wollei NIES-4236]